MQTRRLRAGRGPPGWRWTRPPRAALCVACPSAGRCDRVVGLDQLAAVVGGLHGLQATVRVLVPVELAAVEPALREVQVAVPVVVAPERVLHCGDLRGDERLQLGNRRGPDGEHRVVSLDRAGRAVLGSGTPDRTAELAQLSREQRRGGLAG